LVWGIEVTILSVEGAACGYSAVISASKINRDLMNITVDCDCEIIARWSKGLLEFNWRDSLRPKTRIAQLVKGETISHAACPVPLAVRKAIEVEIGAARPQDINITFVTHDQDR
jgi:hypothetical protein